MSAALDIACGAFEARFTKVIDGRKFHHAFPGPDGEYIAFGLGAPDDETAVRVLFNALNTYAGDAIERGRDVLIWRIRPEAEGPFPGHKKLDLDPVSLCLYEEDQAPYWKSYARLVIVDIRSPEFLSGYGDMVKA